MKNNELKIGYLKKLLKVYQKLLVRYSYIRLYVSDDELLIEFWKWTKIDDKKYKDSTTREFSIKEVDKVIKKYKKKLSIYYKRRHNPPTIKELNKEDE